jgi:hypothetical protein
MIVRILHCTRKLLKELDVPLVEPENIPSPLKVSGTGMLTYSGLTARNASCSPMRRLCIHSLFRRWEKRTLRISLMNSSLT